MRKNKRVLALLMIIFITITSIPITPIVANAAGESEMNDGLKPIVQYNFDEMSGTTVKDMSGHGYNGALGGDATWCNGNNAGGVSFSGNGQVSIPAGVMNDVHNVTIMMDYYVTKQVTNTWLFALGPNSGTYIFMNSRNSNGRLGGGITNNGNSDGWRTEQDVSAESPSGWSTLTLVISKDTKQELLYVNGTLAESRDDITPDPATMFQSSEEFSGYIAKSLYAGDPGFNGVVDNFRIYDSALNSEQISDVIQAVPSSVSKVSVITGVGEAPELPTSVDAIYTDGTTKKAKVTWETVSPESYGTMGTFKINGTVDNGRLSVEANVTVMGKLVLKESNTTAHTAELTWDARNDADLYSVYRSNEETTGYSLVYQGKDNKFTDTKLDEAQKYYYKITYTKNKQESVASDVLGVMTKAGTPSAPVLNQKNYTDDSITITWDGVHGTDYYKLYRSDKANGTFTQIYSGTNRSYTDSGLASETTYYYKAEADNTYGASDLSNVYTASTRGNTVADWKMNKSAVVSGNEKDGNMIIKDASGNGNDIHEMTYGSASDWSEYLTFTDESMTGDAQSLKWTEKSARVNGTNTGADFVTGSDAMINSEDFTDGYTIELLYKFPSYWTTSQKWMSLIQRSGSAQSMPEPQGTFNVAISNCKETQVQSSNAADDKSGKFDSAWGVSMDEGNKWYDITIVNDTKSLIVYVNGAEGFRSVNEETNPNAILRGIYADPNDGRFRIGSQYYSGSLDKLILGNLQEVRISDTALSQSDWLVPDPTKYLQDYGSDSAFSMHNDNDYNMAYFPDTQYEIEDSPQTMTEDVKWLIHNAEANRIKAVTHLGDVVQVDDSKDENDRALNIFSQLYMNKVALFMQPGNHDFYNSGGDFGEHSYDGVSDYYRNNWGSESDYVKNFGNYVEDAQLTNDSPSGLSSYMIYNAGSYKYMVISLAWNQYEDNAVNKNDFNWFENVLKEHQDIPTIVTSHTLFACSPTDPSAIALDNSNEDGQNGTKVWNVVKKYDQVFLMIAGHNHGAGMMTLTNDKGNSVYGVLADYQFAYNGGNGWMKMMEYNEKQNKIYISTFSPYAASLSAENKTFFDQNYLTGTGNYNELDFDFATRFAGMQTSVYKVKADEIAAEIATLPATITLENKAEVNQILAHYNNLTNDEKPLVSNYSILSTAVSSIQKQEDLAAAQKVIDKINLLPELITENDKSAVQDARRDYDALTDDQKAMVTNYNVLVAAEDTIAKAEGKKTSSYTDADNTCRVVIEQNVVPDGKIISGIHNVVETTGENYKAVVDALARNGFRSLMVNNITLLDMNQNEIHQLKGNVTVSIKIPDGTDSQNLKVFYYNTQDGSLTDMNAVNQNGYMVFQTDHFSTYVLADKAAAKPDGGSSGNNNGENSGKTPDNTGKVPDNPSGNDTGNVPVSPDANTSDNVTGNETTVTEEAGTHETAEENPSTGDTLSYVHYQIMILMLGLSIAVILVSSKEMKKKLSKKE